MELIRKLNLFLKPMEERPIQNPLKLLKKWLMDLSRTIFAKNFILDDRFFYEWISAMQLPLGFTGPELF